MHVQNKCLTLQQVKQLNTFSYDKRKIYIKCKSIKSVTRNFTYKQKNVEFLAANAPEIRTNLQSIAETLETVVSVLENQIYFNRDNAAIVEKLNDKFELEKSCKNQAYDFILTERLLNRFKLFCSCYPVSTYDKKTGCDIISK